MHADKREEIDAAEAGDIVAIMGIDCASGDTYCRRARSTARWRACSCPSRSSRCRSRPLSRADADKLSKALQRFRKEDPTFRVFTDEETSETIIAGMGELHLEIYVERIRREYKVELEVGAPKVSYREAPTAGAEFNYKHKKQTGGSGQYAHIVGCMEPLPRRRRRDRSSSRTRSSAAAFPREFIPSVEKGFRDSLAQGPAGRVSGRRPQGDR